MASMKVLHTADWHLGKRLGDFSRLEEQQEVLEEICQVAEQQEVDVVLVAGDILDTPNPSSEAQNLLCQCLTRLADGGRRAVIAIAGNHDSPNRIEANEDWARECGILLVGWPNKKVQPFSLHTGLEVLKAEEGFVEMKLPNHDFPLRLLLTPYASELTLRRFMGTDDRDEELRNVLAEHWQNLADEYCDEQGVNLLVSHHFFVRKGETPVEEEDGERPILHVGGAQAIFSENIPSQIQYTALGHIHRYFWVAKSPCPVVYSSSPLSYSFSEAGQEKRLVLVELEPNKEPMVSAHTLTKGRPLERKRFEEFEQAMEWLANNQEAYVELTLVSDTYISAEEKKQLYDAHSRIVSIIPELRGEAGQSEEKRETIDLSKSRKELFKDFFQSRTGQQADEALLSLFDELLDA